MRSGCLALGTLIVALLTGCHKTAPVRTSAPAPLASPRPPAAAPRSQPAQIPVRASVPARSAPPTAAVSAKPLEDMLNSLLDAYFDYNDAKLRSDALSNLSRNSDNLKTLLRRSPDARFQIVGACDERGSAEYNLALGDRRAHAAQEFLIQAGVPAERLTTISYGKDRPVCTEHNETC